MPICRTRIAPRRHRSGRSSRRTKRRWRAAIRPSASRNYRPPLPAATARSRSQRRESRRRRRLNPTRRVPSRNQRCSCPRRYRRPHPISGANGRSPSAGGSLGEALKNLERYVQTFDNPQGGGGQFGPEIQFDTKGVEFGPWIRRFVAQVKRNWLIPYAAMSQSGHVVDSVQRAQERPHHRSVGRRAVPDRCVQQRGVRRARVVESHAAAAAGVPGGQGVLHRDVFLQRNTPMTRRHARMLRRSGIRASCTGAFDLC